MWTEGMSEKDKLLFTCHCSARCFRAECAEIPRVSRAKLHEMQLLCIAKRVAVNEVNSNKDNAEKMK